MDTSLPFMGNLVLDDAGRIANDIRCLTCGYNLRGLLPAGRCPECGTAVGRSTYGDLLQFCEPAWVETLASGMNWIIAALCVNIVVGIPGLVIAMVTGKHALASLLGIVGVLVSLIGYWKVTEPDPGQQEEKSANVRTLVRYGWMISTALSCLTSLASPSYPMINHILMLPASLISLVATIAIFVYAQRLALRIPDRTLARHTRIVMWGAIVVSILGMLLVAALLIGVSSMMKGSASSISGVDVLIPVLMMFGCMVASAALAFAVWAIVLIVQYRKAFRQAAQDARQSWASSAPAT